MESRDQKCDVDRLRAFNDPETVGSSSRDIAKRKAEAPSPRPVLFEVFLTKFSSTPASASIERAIYIFR